MRLPLWVPRAKPRFEAALMQVANLNEALNSLEPKVVFESLIAAPLKSVTPPEPSLSENTSRNSLASHLQTPPSPL